jgi:hypothetical protein
MERPVDHTHHLSLRRLRPLRALLSVLVALTMAACVSSGGGGGEGPGTDPPTSQEPTSEETSEPDPDPEPEDPDATTPESPGGNDNPAISVARLPVGGGSELREDDPTLQCAEVSWIVDNDGEIPRGTAVELTRVLFTPAVFRVVSDGCGTAQPNCVGFIFRAAAQRCDLLVRLVGTIPEGTGPSVGFAGNVYCPRNDSESCRRFVEALGDQRQISVQLTVPPQPEPESESESESESKTT